MTTFEIQVGFATLKQVKSALQAFDIEQRVGTKSESLSDNAIFTAEFNVAKRNVLGTKTDRCVKPTWSNLCPCLQLTSGSTCVGVIQAKGRPANKHGQ